MSKRFVKNRYPEAYSVKTNGWILGDPFIIRERHGGMILKGKDVDEKKAWANLKKIIQDREKAEKGLSLEEIIVRRKKIAKIEILKIKYKTLDYSKISSIFAL